VRRIDENDDYYRKLSNQWAGALRAAVASMDEYKD
jgi:predicted proteasome-type protease